MEQPVRKDERAKILNRLRRIEGQARGIQRMVTEGEDCTAIITQLTAMQAAVQKATKVVLGHYLVCCVEEEVAQGGDYKEALRLATDVLIRARF